MSDPTTSRTVGPWTEVPTGHAIRIADEGVQCRNAKGRVLATVPPAVKKTAEYERMDILLGSLEQHRVEQARAVETWMLRGAGVPLPLLGTLWEDPDARDALRGVLVMGAESAVAGLLVDAGPDGIVLAGPDGARRAVTDARLRVAHPVTVEDADRWRLALAEHGLTQGVEQLGRAVFRAGEVEWLRLRRNEPEAPYVLSFEGGAAAFLNHGRLLRALLPLGAELSSGGIAVRVREAGADVVARLEIDGDSPEHPSYVDGLAWFDPDGRRLTFEEIGPVAWSEGVRLAARVRDAGEDLTPDDFL